METFENEFTTEKRETLNITLENIILESFKPRVELSINKYVGNKEYFVMIDIPNIGVGKVVDEHGEPYMTKNPNKASKILEKAKAELMKGRDGDYTVQITSNGIYMFLTL
jgi:flagellar biosynthesis/type III secretory pathway ATPase